MACASRPFVPATHRRFGKDPGSALGTTPQPGRELLKSCCRSAPKQPALERKRSGHRPSPSARAQDRIPGSSRSTIRLHRFRRKEWPASGRLSGGTAEAAARLANSPSCNFLACKVGGASTRSEHVAGSIHLGQLHFTASTKSSVSTS